jgi:hypothetical protein
MAAECIGVSAARRRDRGAAIGSGDCPSFSSPENQRSPENRSRRTRRAKALFVLAMNCGTFEE